MWNIKTIPMSPFFVLIALGVIFISNNWDLSEQKDAGIGENSLGVSDTEIALAETTRKSNEILQEIDTSLDKIKIEFQNTESILEAMKQGMPSPTVPMAAPYIGFHNNLQASGEQLEAVERKVSTIREHNEKKEDLSQERIKALEAELSRLQNEDRSSIPLWNLVIAVLAMVPSWIQLFMAKKENGALKEALQGVVTGKASPA